MKEKVAGHFLLQPEAALAFTEIARDQGVQQIVDFNSLLGDPSPDDESPEEFAAMLRGWRREGSCQEHE